MSVNALPNTVYFRTGFLSHQPTTMSRSLSNKGGQSQSIFIIVLHKFDFLFFIRMLKIAFDALFWNHFDIFIPFLGKL